MRSVTAKRVPRARTARVTALAVSIAFVPAVGGGCAAPLSGQPSATVGRRSGDATAGWQALISGDGARAAESFQVALGKSADDVLALFGDAALAFERGDTLRAMERYLTLLEKTPSAMPARAWVASVLAPMAAARVAVLLDELPGEESERRAYEDRVLAVALNAGNVPWPLRYELAMLSDRIARRRQDPLLLGRHAGASGCVRTFALLPPNGGLPHVDLDRDLDTGGVRPWRTVSGAGCRVTLPSSGGRPGAQRARAEIVGFAAGEYDIVLDIAAEARLGLDGQTVHRHGDASRYGPRLAATRVHLGAGRHTLELAVATQGGRVDVALMVVPASAATTPEGARRSDLPDAAFELADAYLASRRGDAERAWRAAGMLEKRPRFAVGQALLAVLSEEDPSLPAAMARDRARSFLRQAVAVDPSLARPRHGLGALALDEDRARDALVEAQAASAAAPGWWLPELTIRAAARARGLLTEADRALDRAAQRAPGACAVLLTRLERAEERQELAAADGLRARLAVCDPEAADLPGWLRRRGDLAGAERALRRAFAVARDPDAIRLDLAAVWSAAGQPARAAALLAAERDPRDGETAIRLADAQIAAGDRAGARHTVEAALRMRSDLPDVVRAARAMAVPLPLDTFRIDGRQVIRELETSGRRYASPAVIVLDRTVTRLFPDGAQVVLTHNIVRVDSKQAVDTFGEVSVPNGAEILTLRTHKRDGSSREPEELAGKETISAKDLSVGDYVEWETLEWRGADDGSTPDAFLGDRFYFQSFDAPLDRTEYLIVTDRATADGLAFDARAGAPTPERSSGDDGLVVVSFVQTGVSQLYAEQSAAPAVEFVPSVRAAKGLDWAIWARVLRERLHGTQRSSPAIERLARDAKTGAGDGASAQRLAQILTAMVTTKVQPGETLRESAAHSAARGRGNRAAVLCAAARSLELPCRIVFARSRVTADAEVAPSLHEIAEFSEPLVRFDLSDGPIFVDTRLDHAGFGYLPPGLAGARVFDVQDGTFAVARGRGEDERRIALEATVDENGAAKALVKEQLRGWPALEWAATLDRLGSDRTRLRQHFEQSWLGVHFPGAVLADLEVEIVDSSRGPQGGTLSPADAAGSGSARGYTADRVLLSYSFSSRRLAERRGSELVIRPWFFRGQPGRRYATEPQRKTPLVLGPDIPLVLDATVQLPPGTTAPGEPPRWQIGQKDGPKGPFFVEERTFVTQASRDGQGDALGPGPRVQLHREARLPVAHVEPEAYPALAKDLRRIDLLEQHELRVKLPPAASSRTDAAGRRGKAGPASNAASRTP